MMRDPNRIDTFLQELGTYWKKVPDWRFGQFISNLFGYCWNDPFRLEEDEFMNDVVKKFFDARQ